MQGNFQPAVVGVFDTVAALGNALVTVVAWAGLALLFALIGALIWFSVHWVFWAPLIVLLGLIAFWYGRLRWSQWKYDSSDEHKPLKITNIQDWPEIWKHGHRAV